MCFNGPYNSDRKGFCPHKKAKITAAMAVRRLKWPHDVKAEFVSDWSKVN